MCYTILESPEQASNWENRRFLVFVPQLEFSMFQTVDVQKCNGSTCNPSQQMNWLTYCPRNAFQKCRRFFAAEATGWITWSRKTACFSLCILILFIVNITNYPVVRCNTIKLIQPQHHTCAGWYITRSLYIAGTVLRHNSVDAIPGACLRRIYQMTCCQEGSERMYWITTFVKKRDVFKCNFATCFKRQLYNYGVVPKMK